MPTPSLPRRPTALAALLVSLPLLGGCQTQGDVTGSIYPATHGERHPIVIADAPRVLDVFVEGVDGLSPRSRTDVSAFVGEYRARGTGALVAQVPVGYGTNPSTRRALDVIRSLAGGPVAVSQYQPLDPGVASPIRLTFKRLQAKVGSQCGLWPDDLGVGDYRKDWRNEQYWNLGCAAQANLASQLDDPSDLVRGRQETRPDTVRRMYNFEQLRKGTDPSTDWKTSAASVSAGIGGGN